MAPSEHNRAEHKRMGAWADRAESGEQTVFPAGGGTTLARFDQPRGRGTTLAVVADPHLTPTARGTFKLFHRTKQRFQMAIADAHRLDVDGLVVAGDLTKDGGKQEHALTAELLGTAPNPTLSVPGNHDLTAGGDGASAAFGRQYAGGPYPTTELIDGTAVSLLDSTHPDGTVQVGGGLSEDALDHLACEASGVAVLHHPISPIPDPVEAAFPASRFRLREPKAVADALVDAGVDLVVSGHIHWPYATTYRGLKVVGAPSSSSFPPAYLLLHIDPRGTTVSIVPLADRAGLTEAYEFAVADERRGDAIREAVAGGYFGGLPMVEEIDGPADSDLPTAGSPAVEQ